MRVFELFILAPADTLQHRNGEPRLSTLLESRALSKTQPSTRTSRRDPSRSVLLDCLRVAVAVLIIPEIPRLIWHLATHLPWHMRGFINSEYLVLLAVAWLFPSRTMVALLTGELVIIAVEPMAALYNVPFRDAFGVLGNLALLPANRLALYGCLLLLYAVTCACLLAVTLGRQRLPRARGLAVTLLVAAILPLMADMAEGRYYTVHISRRPSDLDGLLPYQAATMPVVQLAKELTMDNELHEFGLTAPHPIPSTLSHAIAELPANEKPDIVLVLTESWGLAKDERMNQTEYAPYLTPAIADRYRVEIGKTPFQGGTIAGEFRELCGEARGLSVLAEAADHLQQCWPAKLNREGYSTLAVHGFTSLMFNRRSWYDRFGFQKTAFLEDLSRQRLTRCNGAFHGICDADVAKWIGDKLLVPGRTGPAYVHWVTLNTHLPIAPLAPGVSRQDCVATGIDIESSLCSWFEQSLIVHRSVSQLATRPGLRPTVFVIVGDHAPPFMNENVRNRFSPTDVPYVILMPKNS